MMKPLSNLLNTPGFFLCEKSRCILRIKICIKRQEMSNTWFKNNSKGFAICANCEQGEKNMAFFKEQDIPFILPEVNQHQMAAN